MVLCQRGLKSPGNAETRRGLGSVHLQRPKVKRFCSVLGGTKMAPERRGGIKVRSRTDHVLGHTQTGVFLFLFTSYSNIFNSNK